MDNLMRPNPFHVKILLVTDNLWKHEFYYNTDCRFEIDLTHIDTVAIYHWSKGLSYNSKNSIKF